MQVVKGRNPIYTMDSVGDAGCAYERKTRVFFHVGFYMILINRIVEQIATNMNIEFLTALPLVPVALCFLFIRCLGTMLGAHVKRVAFALCMIALSFISFLKCGQSYLPVACLLLCGVGNIDVRRVIKVVSACILLLVFGLGLIQFFDWVYTGNLAGSVLRSGGRLRISCFFVHPNTLAAITCMACIGLTAFHQEFKAADIIFITVVCLLVIAVTDSRTSTAILLLYLLLRCFLQRRRCNLDCKALFAFALLPVLFEVVALSVPPRLLPNAIISAMNVLLNGRPGYWILQYEQLGGFTLFGQMSLYGDQVINGWLYPSVTIDCFYAASLLQLGAWSFPVFFYLYLRAGRQAVKENDHFKFSALIVCALFGFTEIHMIDFAICFLMLLLGENLITFSNVATNGRKVDLDIDISGEAIAGR